ncbi:MAG: MoxR family ATPase [Oscillospiraceae bacterium]|jgi:MoxR-like ATPase|nr:MoxR family ATPase [Oscillospiraceae bacterium]
MNNSIQRVLGEVRKVIVGKDDTVEKVLMAALAPGHVLLEDVPGVGKTTMVLAFAKALGLETKRIQFTSDSLPSDVTGFSVLDKDSGEFRYKPGAIMTNILLADEINRTSSKTQSALLEAMEEGRVTVDGVTHALPEPFFVLATQNPVGSAGTQLLPASQLDRFIVRLSMGYPDAESEAVILRERRTENPLDSIAPAMTRAELLAVIAEVREVYIDDRIYGYVTALARETRVHPLLSLGVSTRGSLALCRMAKARAYLNGRGFVTPEDAAAVAPDVFAHRLILGSKARFSEVTGADIAREVLKNVELPVLEELRR